MAKILTDSQHYTDIANAIRVLTGRTDGMKPSQMASIIMSLAPNPWDALFSSIDDGTYKDKYAIGDILPLDLGSEGIINMQIAAFDTDDLADGSGKASITWIAKETLATDHRINPLLSGTTEGTGNIGGWELMEMRSYLIDTIKPLIPSNVNDRIKTVTKHSLGMNMSGAKTQYTTQDDVWIPSYQEVTGRTEYDTGGYGYTDLLSDNASRIKYKTGSETPHAWWLRSAGVSTSMQFYIAETGMYGFKNPKDEYGVVLCFCT